MKRTAGLLLALALLAGCSSEDEPTRRTEPPAPTPAPAPAAFALDKNALRRLPADYGVLEREGRAVGSTEWDPYLAAVLAEYLGGRGIRLDELPKRLEELAIQVSERQEVAVMLLTDAHRRRYARRLARLRPGEDELARFYERFSEETDPDAGRGMLDWLRVLRVALPEARGETTVVVPLPD